MNTTIVKSTLNNTEVSVILHTEHGDVVTCYPLPSFKDAVDHFRQLVESDKKASMQYNDHK